MPPVTVGGIVVVAGDAGTVLAVGQGFDGVEDLHVAGAPAQVGAEMAGGVAAGHRRALLVDQALGPQHDAGDAEPALEGAPLGEGAGVAGPFVVAQAFEGGDLLGLGAGQRHLAGHDRLAIQQHGAAAALPARRAAVLGTRDTQLLPEGGEQVFVVPDLDLLAVEPEGGHDAPISSVSSLDMVTMRPPLGGRPGIRPGRRRRTPWRRRGPRRGTARPRYGHTARRRDRTRWSGSPACPSRRRRWC